MQKPYLNLRDRISQTWINKYTIILILISLKLIIFKNSLLNSLNLIQNYTINSCPTIDTVSSNLVSLPHYLSKSANYIILNSIDQINDSTKDALKLILTASENLIIFTLELVIGTYACVLVSTIDGAVDIAVNTTESIISWVNGTLIEIVDEVEDGLEDLSTVVNKVLDTADNVIDFITGDDSEDTSSYFNSVNLTIEGLRNLQIPSSINDKLNELKEKTPDFDTVKNETEYLIKIPFESIKSKIENETLILNDDDLYVCPIIESNVCSNNIDSINSFYDQLDKDISKTFLILIIILFIVAILVIIPIAFTEYIKWKRLNNLVNSNDFIESYEFISNRFISNVGLYFSRFSNNGIKIRWLTSYVLSNRSLILLSIGMAGLISVLFQFLILNILQRSIDSGDNPFDAISSNLTSEFTNSITAWTNSTNEYLNEKETEINDELFTWIKEGTDSINDTVSAFVDDMNEVISDVFGDTILYDPVKTIVGCVIENKLIKIEEGLTWIYDNAEISLPSINETYLSKGLEDESIYDTSDISSSIKEMMLNLLNSTLDAYKSSILFELYISAGLIGCWVLQLLIGLILFVIDKEEEEEEIIISKPRQLTKSQQILYNYPITEIEEDDQNTIDTLNLNQKSHKNEYNNETESTISDLFVGDSFSRICKFE